MDQHQHTLITDPKCYIGEIFAIKYPLPISAAIYNAFWGIVLPNFYIFILDSRINLLGIAIFDEASTIPICSNFRSAFSD
jgi:hypothetical protein